MSSAILASPVAARAESPIVRSIATVRARIPVESSMLAAIAYNKRRKILELEFLSGSSYQYLNVPAPLYRALLAADSKGRFYNSFIKRRFESQKVTAAIP